jgi:type VI secretion system secreted protein Hcp
MKTVLSFLIVSLISIVSAHAQVTEIFVKIIDANGTQINGESNDIKHQNEIVTTSFGQENINCSTITGGVPCAGKAGHFIFNMNINKSLPLLKKALYNTEHLLSVDIVFRKAGGTPFEFYKIRLENVIITHITDAADASTGVKNQVEADAARFGWTYIGQKSDGTSDAPIKFGWDVTSNSVWTGF